MSRPRASVPTISRLLSCAPSGVNLSCELQGSSHLIRTSRFAPHYVCVSRVMPRSGLTLPLTTTRPTGVVREPAYRGTPYSGVIKLGDGPRAETRFVADRTPDERRYENRLYFDRNHNGDFTDDGDGELQSVGKNIPGARVGPHFTSLPASWGGERKETAAGE